MDIGVVQSAIAAQFPRVDLSGLRPLGEGGVFGVFETDSGIAWRFLKQPVFADGLDQEIRLLPELAAALSLPVPRYEYVSDRNVSPRFVGYRKIVGVPFTSAQVRTARSGRPLRQLAQCLTELHTFPVERAQALSLHLSSPVEHRAQRAALGEQIRRHVTPLLDEQQQRWAERTLSEWLGDTALDDFTPALCHADLWAEHVLFDPEHGELTGVIDWESAGLGDPIGDWVALWLDHGEETVRTLLRFYRGPVNATFWTRLQRQAEIVPLHEILCDVLYQDHATGQAGWKHLQSGL